MLASKRTIGATSSLCTKTLRNGYSVGMPSSPSFKNRRCSVAVKGSSENEPEPNRKGAGDYMKASWRKLVTDCSTYSNTIVKAFTPKREGDFMDWTLMVLSIVVFTYIAMQLYKMYAYWYYAAGLQPMSYYLQHLNDM